jgi:NADH-ubiquinone oxidoreductase chain 5
MCSMSGAALSFVLYSSPLNSIFANIYTPTGKTVYTFLNNKWHFDFVFNHYIAKPALIFGHDVTYKIIDRGLIEQVGPTGLTAGLKKLTTSLSNIQSGLIYNYAFAIFLATTVILMFIPSISSSNTELQLFLILPIFAYLIQSDENKA